jgi:threonine/homoserine/homoserine lactone efflux protein
MLARSAHTLFLAMRYAGAAYLLYLGYRLWTAPTIVVVDVSAPPAERGSQLFLASLSLTLSNPKAMIFYLALLPTVVDLPNLTLAAYLEVALTLSLILCAVLMGYAIVALRARQLFLSSRAQRWLNRSAGTVLAGAAVVVATR